jgi:hypothetical protein
MQQQLSVITLGIAELGRSRRFYCDGFGWTPVFQNEGIVFYQMNGFVLGTWLAKAWRMICAGRCSGRGRSRWPTM